MIKEITTFIASKTSFAVGSTIVAGHRIQTDADRCNVVIESAGGAVYFDLPQRVDKLIQIISRALTYMDALADAREIYDAIHGTAGWTMSAVAPATQDYEAQTIEALADPQYIGQDDKRRFEFSTNYIFRIKNS